MKHLITILFGLLLAGAGLAAGHLLSQQEVPETGHVHGPSCTHGVPGDTASTKVTTLSAQTLKGLGVEIAPAQRSDFVRVRRIQAVVVDRPLNARPVAAPLGGLVTDVRVEVGQITQGGDLLVALARDPIQRPKPELTASIFAPLNESVHELSAKLRSAAADVVVTQRELDRVRPFVEKRTLPKKMEIDLIYLLEKQQKVLESTRKDLHLHGLTEAEIAAVEAGKHPPASRKLWKRALQHNGIWTDNAEAIHSLLIDSGCDCDLPWCVASIGELAATGLVTEALVTAFEEDPDLLVRFADVAGLLLQGMPLGTILELSKKGALEERIVVRAPGESSTRWDVEAVLVRPGQRVQPGQELISVHDARRMWLRLQPVGAEMPLVLKALQERTPLAARPLVKGAGPMLEGVRLTRLETHTAHAERGGLAIAEVENRALGGGGDGSVVRSWALREGLRYLVEVPLQSLEGRFVLPFDGVTRSGPDRIVFLQDGSSFRAQVVHVEYEDDQVAVIADDGSIFEGDMVVTHGAFALGLALDTGGDTGESDHGHAHN